MPARDRISAARVVLGLVRDPLGVEPSEAAQAEPAEDWAGIVLTTARRATELANHGLVLSSRRRQVSRGKNPAWKSVSRQLCAGPRAREKTRRVTRRVRPHRGCLPRSA
jgi:hypothetical protein